MFAMKLDAEAEDIGFALGGRHFIEEEMGVMIENIQTELVTLVDEDDKPVYLHLGHKQMIDSLGYIISQYESMIDDLDDPANPSDPALYKRLSMELSLAHDARKKIDEFIANFPTNDRSNSGRWGNR